MLLLDFKKNKKKIKIHFASLCFIKMYSSATELSHNPSLYHHHSSCASFCVYSNYSDSNIFYRTMYTGMAWVQNVVPNVSAHRPVWWIFSYKMYTWTPWHFRGLSSGVTDWNFPKTFWHNICIWRDVVHLDRMHGCDGVPLNDGIGRKISYKRRIRMVFHLERIWKFDFFFF